MSFGRLLIEAMAGHGHRPAMVSDHEELTHAQALTQAEHIAANLSAAGIAPGDRVGIAVQDTLESALVVLACWRLSATPAVIDFRTPRAQRARMARDFGLSPMLENGAPRGKEAYPALAFEREWRFASKPARAAPGPVDCSNPAFLVFSSGTTGDAKAYVQSHEALARRLHGGASATDRIVPRFLTPTLLSFQATLSHAFTTIHAGGVVRFFPPLFTPSDLIEGLLAFKTNFTSLPPPVIARLVKEAGPRSSVLFPDLDMRSSGGPARPEDKVAAYRYLTPGYSISYGTTLTGLISMLAGDDVLVRPESTGRPVDGVRIEILDEDGNPLPPGERGVIKAWTRRMAPAVLLPGGRPFVDPKVMGPDWGIPGDIGFLDEDGFLTIVDRQEDMIVRGGVNVAPQELEKLIRAHPKVTDVAVAGFPDDMMGQEIAAFVVSEAGLTLAELRGFLSINVPPDKRPRELRLVSGLPYNANGKLQRRVLVENLMREKAQPLS